MQKIHTPVNLWGLAKILFPSYIHAYNHWFDVSKETLRMKYADHAIALAEKRHPYDMSKQNHVIDILLGQRVTKLRNTARHLLHFVLPDKIRQALLSGNYKITAFKHGEKERVTLTVEDLAGVTVDLTTNQLVCATTCYSQVAITRRVRLGSPHSVIQNFKLCYLDAIKRIVKGEVFVKGVTISEESHAKRLKLIENRLYEQSLEAYQTLYGAAKEGDKTALEVIYDVSEMMIDITGIMEDFMYPLSKGQISEYEEDRNCITGNLENIDNVSTALQVPVVETTICNHPSKEKNRKGRKEGTGSFEKFDMPYIEIAIKEEKYQGLSAHARAGKLINEFGKEIVGGGTEYSKQRRLEKHISKKLMQCSEM